MKVVVVQHFGQAISYAKKHKVQTYDLCVVTPQNWKMKLQGRTFSWDDVEYLPFPPEAFPPEFYEYIKICVHSTQS